MERRSIRAVLDCEVVISEITMDAMRIARPVSPQEDETMSSAMDAVLERNRDYAEQFTDAGLPGRPRRLKLAVLTCLDCRLHVPEFMGLELGDAHILRNAGGSSRRTFWTSSSEWACFHRFGRRQWPSTGYLDLDGDMLGYLGVGRLAAVYSGRHMDDARAGFLFRTERPLDYDHRDRTRQMDLVREAFGDMGGEVPRWLDELDRTRAFYFDSITQICMDTWSKGRVTLVGDAGYGPGPAVGGGTSLAVVGAYVLAGELAESGGDHEHAFAAYEREIGDYVRGCRKLGRRAARTLMSMGRIRVWAVIQGARLVSHLPTSLTRVLARLGTKTGSLHESVVLKDYPSP